MISSSISRILNFVLSIRNVAQIIKMPPVSISACTKRNVARRRALRFGQAVILQMPYLKTGYFHTPKNMVKSEKQFFRPFF